VTTPLEIVPLGGLGEFGMNLMVFRHGSDCVVVDAGMMFPGAEHLGVDVVIPNMDYLETCGTIHGVVLTHGHEDHIGALPFLLARHDVPVWGTPYTLGLVRGRLEEHDHGPLADLRALPPAGETLRLGPFAIEALPVAHSIPQSRMLVIGTPLGTIVHTADLKLDPRPLDGEGTDLARLARLGEHGVLVLLSDSTNADRPGVTPGERTLREPLEQLIAGARGRVFVTTFSSNIQRLQQIVDIAHARGRRVTVVGSSMQFHVETADSLGLLRWPAGIRIDAERAMDLDPERVVVLVTGSQGEPSSALARIAVDAHREISIGDGDLVIHAARSIPGNEKPIGRMVNHLLRRGAQVVTEADAPVHVSGHAAQGDLRLLIELLRPRFFVPVHGEYRQLAAHARTASQAGLEADAILLADSGDVITVGDDAIGIGERVPVGQVFIDASLDTVDLAVLKERRRLAGDGIVVAVVAVDREDGSLDGDPEIVSRGFVALDDEEEVLREARAAVREALQGTTLEERGDEGLLKERIQTGLKRFFRRRIQKRPLIIPVIVEL